jgi:hypothetical protein
MPSRSKSPSRSAAAKSSDPLQDPHAQAALAFAILGGLVHLSVSSAAPESTGPKSAADPAAWTAFFNGNGGIVHATYWDYGWIPFLHALNTAQNADGSYWLNSFINTFIATFACALAKGIFFGEGIAKTIETVATTSNIALVFICWFFTNNDHTAKYWGMVKDSPIGTALSTVLSTATLVTIAQAATEGDAATMAKGDSLTNFMGYFAIAMPVFKATVIGSAGNFLPLDKGFSFEGGLDEAAERAFATAFYMNVASYTLLVPEAANKIAVFFGATTVFDASFVVLATVIAEFTFNLCPALTSPLAAIQDKIFDITNLNRD